MKIKLPPCSKGSRRKAILDVASSVFSQEGYGAASMSHIAARLGGSKGTLYHYFKSKEELFDAHVKDHCTDHVAMAFAQPLSGDNPVIVLTGLAERILTAIMADESTAFYSLVVSEAQRNPLVGPTFYENGPALCIRRVADYLEWAREAGHIATDDCVIAAEDFLSLVHGRLHFKRMLNVTPRPSPAEIQAEASRLAQTFIRAYVP